jgi:chemotaxis protein methyltransferase CheR
MTTPQKAVVTAPSTTPPLPRALSTENYKYLQQEVYRESGIVVDENKHYLLEARLTPLVREAGLGTLDDLCARLRARLPLGLMQKVVEALATNETLFFRDMAPFEALQTRLLPEFLGSLAPGQPLQVWSAAASSGQEAYSIAMLLREHGWQGRPLRLLGTDISEQILRTAREATYGQFEVNRGLPAPYLVKYFTPTGTAWQLRDEIRAMVTFRQFDLRQSMAPLGKFHIIFCRNVLIYFDQATKSRILQQLWSALEPGGYLMLGGAESILQHQDRFERIVHTGGAFYRKK